MAVLNEQDDLAVHHDGLSKGKFLIPHCDACKRRWWPPRAVCPSCQSSSFTWTDMPSSMRIFSWTVVHRTPLKVFQELTPYAVAILESDDAEIQVIGRVEGDPNMLEVDAVCTWEIITGPTGEAVPLWYLTTEGE